MAHFNKMHEKEAVSFFRSDKTAILSTISNKHRGYPFGSFVTYVSGWDRTVFLYLSDLADHTKNLKRDHKSCITILKKNENGDIQNSARLTLMGDLEIVPENIQERCNIKFQDQLKKGLGKSEEEWGLNFDIANDNYFKCMKIP